MTPQEKIKRLRIEMAKNKVDVFIVYSADPHMSEYLPEDWKERAWLSGFTGSAGFVVVTADKAGLWTDGRYFTQARQQLEGSGIQMYKDKVVNAVDYIDWILEETPTQAVIAVNAMATSHADWQKLKTKLEACNRKLISLALMENVWTDRAATSVKKPVFAQPVERAGRSVADKISAIRKEISQKGATAHIISGLDDVAWTLNLRGSDVACNPVFTAYILILRDQVFLYVDKEKLTDEARHLLTLSNVEVKDYSGFFPDLKTCEEEIFWLSAQSNQAVFEALKEKNKIITGAVPGSLMKAVKNEAELQGFHSAMIKDGIAMTRFLYWLTHRVGKEDMDENSIAEKLLSFRQQQDNFVGISFDSIIGYQGNGAIIHYKPPHTGSSKVRAAGSLLVDSGGQYLEGTTDITRTLPLGHVSAQFRHDYTLVMKAHIRLAMAVFPKGTRGSQLDILARLPLWEEGKDYNHGTGHGVGSFLNVHEGPQSISKEENSVALVPGMVLSNEPGYYMEGEYGIRHENLMVVKPFKTTEWNTFYAFETLTYCPFFTAPLIREMLTKEELAWLNAYHRTVQEKLAPHLEEEVKTWLIKLTTPF